MPTTSDADRRTATYPDRDHGGGVTLINKFVVAAGRDEEFQALWTRTSAYFRRQPGFRSLRLHRALSADAPYRFVNVARWASLEQFRAAHATDEFRRAVTLSGWEEFPSSPALYEVVVEDGEASACDAPPGLARPVAADDPVRA